MSETKIDFLSGENLPVTGTVGELVGFFVGESEMGTGDDVGKRVGFLLGAELCCIDVGDRVVGRRVGLLLGEALGNDVGITDGE